MNPIELKTELGNQAKMIERYANKKIPDNISFADPRFAHLLCDIQHACRILGWIFLDNYAQWDYWHCITGRGVIPFSLKHLLEKLDEAGSTRETGISD